MIRSLLPFALSEVEVQPQRMAFDFAQAERMWPFGASFSILQRPNGLEGEWP